MGSLFTLNFLSSAHIQSEKKKQKNNDSEREREEKKSRNVKVQFLDSDFGSLI